MAWEYNKVHPVPGPDAAIQALGDGKLRALDTPFGRLSSIICFDGDFPQLLAQAGTLSADVVLDPSNDRRERKNFRLFGSHLDIATTTISPLWSPR